MSGRPGPVLVDVPMDHFSSNLFVDAFSKKPPVYGQAPAGSGGALQIVEALARPNVLFSMPGAVYPHPG